MEIKSFLSRHKVILLILLAAVVIVLRKPDSLFHSQFVAEDGRFWFADCYRLGFKCLLLPQDGYLQTISRLTGLLSLLVPFKLAPVVFTLMALLIQLLPVILLLSPRLTKLHPNFCRDQQ